jgi:hypothetical protein
MSIPRNSLVIVIVSFPTSCSPEPPVRVLIRTSFVLGSDTTAVASPLPPPAHVSALAAACRKAFEPMALTWRSFALTRAPPQISVLVTEPSATSTRASAFVSAPSPALSLSAFAVPVRLVFDSIRAVPPDAIVPFTIVCVV